MGLEIADEHLEAAVRCLAAGAGSPAERLQTAWEQHVQMVWMQPCLTRDLLRAFKALWEEYTAPSDDPHSTTLRTPSHDELVGACDALLALWRGVVETRARGDAQLATLADL